MAHAFALDETIVIDDPDAAPLPLRPRTTTDGALTMQVFVDGAFHRRLAPGSAVPALSRTACDLPIHSQFASTRREELCNPLCRRGCFTPYELELADQRQADELEQLKHHHEPKDDE